MRASNLILRLVICLAVIGGTVAAYSDDAPKKRVVFVAGRPSHDYGSHEHNAGCLLLAKSLQEGMPGYEVAVHHNGWPEDPSFFEGADAIVIYSDGGGGHPVLPHLEQLDTLAKKGVGIVCIHYAVEIPKGEPGNHFLDWIGGYFETHWSVNPHWTANFDQLPDHPITRGVEPFAIEDEWYYHMRFREGMEGVTPILTAVPPKSTLDRPDGPHSGNPHVRKEVGKPQHVAWAAERPDGGRGFGFTGGHFHWNWGDPNFRKTMLNAIVWVAKGEVPENGVSDDPVSLSELKANQDFEQPADFDLESIRKRLNLPDNGSDTGDQGAQKNVKPRFRSPDVTAQTPGHAVDVQADITGAKQLYLVVYDAGNGFACDWADWAEPRLIGPNGEMRLTELPWRSAKADWGEVRVNANAGGSPLRINGEDVPYGIGTHSNSIIVFDLPEGYTQFVARAGLDNGGTDQGGGSSVQFLVFTENPGPVRSDAGSHEPATAVAALDVAPGLEATLFASEPELLSLTNLDIDHRGRVWVCEVVNYRRHNGKRDEGDRILILEDINADGRADTTKVYYQGRDIDSAMGICVLGNQVIVSASPNIFVFTDENGDDVPDRKQVMFANTGQPQHDHSAHSFLFGPDGKLYWNFGNTGKQVEDKQGKAIIDLAGNPVVDAGKPYWGGMPFRCDLDGSNFEVLAHNFRNNYEVTVDSFGNLWQSDNDDDGNRGVRINFVMEFGNYGYLDELTGAGWQTPRTNMESEIPLQHWHLNDPGVVPNLLQTGAGSPTGITVYEGRLLPEVFWDQVIHCDAGPNIVRAYPVTRDGSGYQAETVNLLHGARDDWFRPADVCVAPDGSVFVTDWYDPGVGGHNMVDLERGRLFRIAPPGTKYHVPRFNFTTVDGAMAALRNPNLATRYMAFLALQKLGEEARPALIDAFENDQNPRIRARALWVLGKRNGGDQYVQQALRDANPDIRIVGIRLARQLQLDLIPLLQDLLTAESDAHVLRECAIALRHCNQPEAAALWAELAARYDGNDRWYLEALGIAADRQWDRFLEHWLASQGTQWMESDAARDIVWRSRSSSTPQLLADIIAQGSEKSGPLARYFRAFDFQTGPAKTAALAGLAFATPIENQDDLRLIQSEALQRLNVNDVASAENSKQVLVDALRNMPRDEQFVALVTRFRVAPLYEELMQVARRHGEESLGVAAVKALLDVGQGELLRSTLLSDDEEVALQTARAFQVSADDRLLPLLKEVMNDASQSVELRRRAATGVARTSQGARELLAMAAKGEFDPQLNQAVAAVLHTATDASIRDAASEWFPLPASKNDEPLPPLQELVVMRGDVQRGKTLFATTAQCANCHQVGQEGKEVGPALTEIGSKLSRQALIESILFPSAGISHNYETYAVELDSGNVVTGVLVSQTDDELVIKTQDAIVRRFSTEEVENLHKLNVSLMPADLQTQLSTQDLIDVVEYLTTLQAAQP